MVSISIILKMIIRSHIGQLRREAIIIEELAKHGIDISGSTDEMKKEMMSLTEKFERAYQAISDAEMRGL